MLSFLRLAPVPDSGHHATTGQITILLADDHVAMRRSLRTLLDGETDLRVVGETDSLESVIDQMRTRHPDVLVLDLELATGRGLEMVSQLHAHSPETRLVVL